MATGKPDLGTVIISDISRSLYCLYNVMLMDYILTLEGDHK